MDLLGSEQRKKPEEKGKKIVLMLLIASIILLILILVMIFVLQSHKTKTLGLNIDGQDFQITENMLIYDENGVNYISLQQLSTLIGYDYLRGGYLEYVEDSTKCYLENDNQIVGFEANTNVIYKTIQNSATDYEYYNLNNNILQKNNILYISLEDLNVSCNVLCTFSEENYQIALYTPEYLAILYEESFKDKGFIINSDSNNQKLMAYNMIVVTNESGRLGVVDWNTNSIIGNKYTSMEFNEFSQNFIVSDENKYGIISTNGNIIVELKYENINILNYSPLLYEVELNGKFGIINQNGKTIVNLEYDQIGFPTISNTMQKTLIIEDIDGNDGIVVCKDGKYGIVSLETGKVIIDCNVDKIYSRTDSFGEKSYYIELENTEIDLARYIDYINTVTVVTNE